MMDEYSGAYAESLDQQDELRHLRKAFYINNETTYMMVIH